MNNMEMSKRVVLVYPRIISGWQPQPTVAIPMNLLCIAAQLLEAGYEVKLIDQRVEPQWESLLREELGKNPICVGVSSMTGPQIRHALDISRIVKEHGNTPMVWGGPHPTLMPAQTLENPNVDIVVHGEGDETFLELVQALDGKRPLNTVTGIWYKNNGDLQSTGVRPFMDVNKQLPLPYHLIDLKNFTRTIFGIEHLDFFTSRGCPHDCTFCYNTAFHKKRWRPMTAEMVIERVKEFVRAYDVKGIYFNDSNFFVDLRRGRQILEGIINANLKVIISKINIDVHNLLRVTDEDFALLQRAGCTRLPIAIESGSKRVSALLKKPVNLERILEINRELCRFGMAPCYGFMIGLPTETEDELAETVSLALRLREENPQSETSFNIYTPFPGTELFDVTVKLGLQPPQKLEDWACFNYRNLTQGAPWLSPKMRRIVEMLDFCNFFVGRRFFDEASSRTHPLVTILCRMYAPVAKMRMRHFWRQFPVEIKLAKLLGLYAKQA